MSFLNNSGVTVLWNRMIAYLTGSNVRTSVISGVTNVDNALNILNTGYNEVKEESKLHGTRVFTYEGKNLITKFGTTANLSTAVRDGDFSDINIGDFIQVTINGNFYDYAAQSTKSINQVMTFEAMPDFFINTNGVDNNIHHILFLSRDLIGQNLQMRSGNETWYDNSVSNPWLGSHLFETLNNKTQGIRSLLEQTTLQGYIYDPPGNGNGIRQYGEKKASGSANSSGWDNYYRGALFLPTETEVWGHAAFSEARVRGDANGQSALQWPIFQGSFRHIQKSNTPGGSRAGWWVASSGAGSTGYFCFVATNGMPRQGTSADTGIGCPIAFLFR